MTDAISTAAYGMRAAMQAFSAHAEKIATADTAAPTQSQPSQAKPGGSTQPPPIVRTMIPAIDVPSEVVGAIQAAASFRANLAVFETGTRLSKRLLDTVA